MEGLDHIKIWESLVLSPATSVGEVREWIEKKGLNVMVFTPAHKNSQLLGFLHAGVSPDWKNICLLLIEKGLQVDYQNESGNSALTIVCQFGTFEKVEFLVENKADVNLQNNFGVTPLMFACSNRNDYARIIHYLISKKASLYSYDQCNRRALDWAFEHSSNIFNTIIPYYRIDLRTIGRMCLMKSCADPYNCWVDALKHNCISTQTEVEFYESHPKTFKEEWLLLRCNELRTIDQSNETDVPFYSQKTKPWWECVLRNGGGYKRYLYGGTLLHRACSANDLEAVKMIIKRKAVNPYLRHRWGFTAYNLIPDKNIEIHHLVHEYMMFKPTVQYAEWLGPYFVEKARTLLLVNQRLRLFSRDVLIYILGWIACLDLY